MHCGTMWELIFVDFWPQHTKWLTLHFTILLRLTSGRWLLSNNQRVENINEKEENGNKSNTDIRDLLRTNTNSADRLLPFSPLSNRTIIDCLSFVERTDRLRFTDMTIRTLASLFSIQCRASHRAWNTKLLVNQNSFECSSLVTTRASAAFSLWEQKALPFGARFNAVVLKKRIWLRILTVTNKY